AQAPHARWSIEQEAGTAWLRTPCGARFFTLGVNAVDGGAPWRHKEGRTAYAWRAFATDLPAWTTAAHHRLAAWGFNTAGAWSLPPGLLGMPSTPELELGRQIQFVWT